MNVLIYYTFVHIIKHTIEVYNLYFIFVNLQLIIVLYVSGNLITSRGPATSVEFGLCLLEVMLGKEVKIKIARDILYPL